MMMPHNINSLNLKIQKIIERSHFKHYQQLTKLRQHDTFVYGSFEAKSLQTKVLAYKRYEKFIQLN